MLAVLCVGLLVLANAGCGGDDGSSDSASGAPSSAEATPTKITMGLIPIVDVAPVMLGIEQGFFKDENLDVNVQFAAGGAAILPAVVKGDYQFGYSNNVSLIVARQEGLPVQIVFPGVDEAETEDEAISHIFSAKGSDIREVSDLAGKTIAVNTLSNIGEITVKEALSKHGVDANSIKLVELPFPEMLQALDAGDVDAIWTAEPFSTNARAAGARPIVASQVETHPGLAISSYFANTKYAQENPEVVKRFARAMTKSFEYATDNREEVEAALVDYAKVQADVAKKINLPKWDPNLDVQDVNLLIDLTQKYDLIEGKPSIDQLILRGERSP